MQSPSPRTRQARARRYPRCRRHRVRVSGPSHSGDRQAADRGARPQSRLSRPGRGAVRLSARRRGADDRLRQDHARLPDGGGHRQHAGHRAVRRTDARRLWHDGKLAGSGTVIWQAREDHRRRQDRLQGIHRHRRRLGAVDRPLQHDGHRLDHERAWPRRSACRCPAAPQFRRPIASARRSPTRPACAPSRSCARI